MSNLVPLKAITGSFSLLYPPSPNSHQETLEENHNRLTAASSKENIRPFSSRMLEEKIDNYLASSQPSSRNSFSFNHNPFKNLSKQNDEYNSFRNPPFIFPRNIYLSFEKNREFIKNLLISERLNSILELHIGSQFRISM